MREGARTTRWVVVGVFGRLNDPLPNSLRELLSVLRHLIQSQAVVRRPFLEDDRVAVAVADEEAVTLRGEASKNRGCESVEPLGYSSVGAFSAVSPLRKAVGTE
nr:hypothetical protein [Ferrimicrobium acidiphilum]